MGEQLDRNRTRPRERLVLGRGNAARDAGDKDNADKGKGKARRRHIASVGRPPSKLES
jgi:hypothetical protein